MDSSSTPPPRPRPRSEQSDLESQEAVSARGPGSISDTSLPGSNGADSNGADSNGADSNGADSNGPESNGSESNGPEFVSIPPDRVSGDVPRTLIFHRIDAPSESIKSLDDDRPKDISQHVTESEMEAAEGETETKKSSASHRSEKSAGDDLPNRERRQQSQPRPVSPLASSITLLITVAIMLVSARFVVPPIVEEIRYAQHRGQLRAEFEVGRDGLKNVSLDTLSQAYQMVTAAAGPSVVHIDVERPEEVTLEQFGFSPFGSDADSDDEENSTEKRRPRSPRRSNPMSDQGSGVIVDADGYILTNRHVIADGETINVTLSDGRRVKADVIGTDGLTDLAVLKVDADGLLPIPWGDSDRIRVGSPVWAIGSPFGLDRTVTFGILSGKHRLVRASSQYQDFMQSDVAVNPGNSGGPLVDARGTLIGINTAIVGDTYQGVSFSIPSSVAKAVYERLRTDGTVLRGWLGVFLSEVDDEKLVGDNHRVRGALITSIADSRAGAAQAGLLAGDIILAVDDEPIRDVGHLMRVIGNALSGNTVAIRVHREGEEKAFDVTLGERPAPLNKR